MIFTETKTKKRQKFSHFGTLLGFGAGLMLPVLYGTFNFYFSKNRIFAMSMVQILKGGFLMVHPILVGFLMSQFGFRGMVAIMAAINANCILAMLAMHPVKWHSKVIKIHVNERAVPCKLRSFSFFLSLQLNFKRFH